MHRTLLAVEWTMPDAFPSLHAAAAVMSLFLAWRLARKVFWICLVPATGLVVATVVLRYHYVIDVIAGIALVPVVAVGAALFHRAWEGPTGATSAEGP